MSRQKPTLEIIPDTRFIVFNGNEHEASSVKLRGVVRFTTPEPMSILKPRIRLEGKRKISWLILAGLSANEVAEKKTFWTQNEKLGGIESSHKVKAGVIEWPFEFELSPSMPESVEGLLNTYVAYHLHASVSRPGWSAKAIVAQQHIRLVRTLGQDSMDVTRSRLNSDIWANKVAYNISIPTDAFVFGTSITADVEISPIKKGLQMGKIDLRLIETVVKRIQVGEMLDTRADRMKSEDVEVAKQMMDFPETSKVTYDQETSEEPVLEDEMYRFRVTLPLPKSLNRCRQDVDSHQVHITHKFKIMVNLHNPEGHISQLVCRLPVKLFISPNLPVDDDSNEVRPCANGLTDEALNNTATTVSAPPQYGQHQLDELFSDMDPYGAMTRAPSLSGSPSGGSVHSNDEDAHEDTGEGVFGSPLEQHGSASPTMLRSRLARLAQNGASNGNSAHNRDPSASHTPTFALSAATSRRGSHDESNFEYRQSDYDIDGLSRVPSYGYALRTSGTATPHTPGLPTYIEATSRPPSPHQRPDPVHLRPSPGSPAGSPGQHSPAHVVGGFDRAAQNRSSRQGVERQSGS